MASYYISMDSGNDTTGDGTSGNPYKTLDKGMSVLSAGDTLYIATSTTDYLWTVRSSIPSGVSVIGSTQPSPVSGRYVKISAGGADPEWNINGDITLRNLWFDNGTYAAYKSPFKISKSASLAQTINVENCIFSNISGTWATGGRGGVFGGGTANGLWTQPSVSITFLGCLFQNIESYASTSAYSLVITYGSAWDIKFISCTYYSGTPSHYALGTLVAIYSTSPTATVTLQNMIIDNNSGSDLYIYGSYTIVLSNSYPSSIDGSTYTNIQATNVTITNSTNAAPQFLDVGASDFRLKPTSPAIDRGVII